MAWDIYLALQGNIYTKITGVTAETAEDVTYYDGSLYDLSVSAQFNGGTQKVLGAEAGSFISTTNGPTGIAGVGSSAISTPVPTIAGGSSAVVPMNSKAVDLSIPAASKVAPVAQAKRRTRYKWATATATYWAWQDQIVCASTTPFGYFGGSIPAPYTAL